MFQFKKNISFYDCDPAGILFYARIFEICHSAYEALIKSFGLSEDYWNNPIYVVPIIKSEAEYRKPLVNGDEVTVDVSVKQLKSSSFELNYTCTNQNGDVCNNVKTVHVFVNKSEWKKSKMSEEIHSGLRHYLLQ